MIGGLGDRYSLGKTTLYRLQVRWHYQSVEQQGVTSAC